MEKMTVTKGDKTAEICKKKGQSEDDYIQEKFCDGVMGSKAYWKCPGVCVGGNTGINPRHLNTR